jgi:hypothetical protein
MNSKPTVIAAFVAALLFQTGCACRIQLTPPTVHLHCGQTKESHTHSTAGLPDLGSIEVAFANMDLAAHHRTRWFLNGDWHKVGGAAEPVKAGNYRIQFWSKVAGDIPPRCVDVTVVPGKSVKVIVDYRPCLSTHQPTRCKHVKGDDTGSVVVANAGSVAVSSGYGQLRAIYVAPATYLNHPTQWSIDSGSWRKVGDPAVTVYAGPHTVQFLAVNANDTPPPTKVPTVPNQTLMQLKVSYKAP